MVIDKLLYQWTPGRRYPWWVLKRQTDAHTFHSYLLLIVEGTLKFMWMLLSVATWYDAQIHTPLKGTLLFWSTGLAKCNLPFPALRQVFQSPLLKTEEKRKHYDLCRLNTEKIMEPFESILLINCSNCNIIHTETIVKLCTCWRFNSWRIPGVFSPHPFFFVSKEGSSFLFWKFCSCRSLCMKGWEGSR